MFLKPYEFQRYIQASAKRANLGVRWVEGAIPHTNGKEIVLPTLGGNATEDDYLKLLHYANHEVDHILYTNFKKMQETECDAMRSFLGFIWNGVEDIRAEYQGGKEYPGDRQTSDKVYPTLLEKGLHALENSKPPEGGRGKLLDQVMPVMWFMNQAQHDNYASSIQVGARIEKLLTPAAQATVKKLREGNYLDEMKRIRDIEDKFLGTDATFTLAKRIFEEVYGGDAEKEMERLKNPPPKPQGDGKSPDKGKEKGNDKGKSAGSDSEGDKPSDSEGSGKGKGKDKPDSSGSKPKDGKGQGEGEPDSDQSGSDPSSGHDGGELGQDDGESSDGRTEFIEVNYREFLPNDHPMQDGEKRKPPTAGMHINYAGYRGTSAYTPATKDEFVVQDFCKKQFMEPSMQKAQDDTERQYQRQVRAALSAGGAGFAARVRTKLQIRSKDRYEYGVKKGKLHGALLHRVTVPDNNHLNERVFKRRIVSDTLDTAVIWLGDGSGSMGGDKFYHLVAASVLFNEALGNVLQIPIEIHSFTDTVFRHGVSPVMFVHRDFACRRLGEEDLIKRMAVAGEHMASNPDGDCILWSYDRLRQHRAKRKLLVVASDGQPATARPGDCDWFTRKVVSEIERTGDVEIVGIGIMDNNVSRIYKEHYVIKSASQLEQALLSLIDKKVR